MSFNAGKTTSTEEPLKVFLRVRPPIYKEIKLDTAVMVPNSNTVLVTSESKETSCSYSHVFGELTEQDDIFEKVKPVLIDTLSGVNSCIFAYGQTSSGKSFTMIGPNGGQDIMKCDKSQWGILPRAAEFLLGYLNDKAKEGLLSYEVKASFLQIYNENLYDLLRDAGPMIDDHLAKGSTELKIREVSKPKSLASMNQGPEIYVSGLSEFRVETSDDILNILMIGTNNRMTKSTDFNFTSSRSHALLTLTFEIETTVESGQTLISRSKLNLIDLAGSEKIPYATSDLSNTKQHMRELTSINKSLSALGNVIAALSNNNRSHIPYRDSKLTRILQDSLGGNTRTILIACIAPTDLHVTETLSTLQFADRAKNVRLTVKANTVVDDKVTLARAQAEIARLKALLTHTMKQLHAKNNGEATDHHNDIERIMEENELLRKENEMLRKVASKQLKASSSVDSLASPRDKLKGAKKNNVNWNNNVIPSAPESARKGEAKKAKMGFNSGVDRFGRRLTDDPDAVSPIRIRKSKITKDKEYDSDGEREMNSRRDKIAAIATPRKVSKGNVKKEKDDAAAGMSKFHSKLYQAINDRQVAELNILLEEANRKIFEQHMRALEPKPSVTPPKPKLVSVQPVDIEENYVVEKNKVHKSVEFSLSKSASEDPASARSDQGGEAGKEKKHRKHKHRHQEEIALAAQENNNIINNNYSSSSSSSNNPAPNAQMQQWFAQQGQQANNNNGAAHGYQLQASHQQYQAQNIAYRPPPSTGTVMSQASSNEGESPVNRIFLKPKGDEAPNHNNGYVRQLEAVPEQMPRYQQHQQPPQQYQQQQPPMQQPQPGSRAMNSANLFANAVQMYNSTHKASNAMMAMAAANNNSNNNSNNAGPRVSVDSHRPANLTGTMDDIGRGLEMFSFRLNVWERIDIIDYDPQKRMYKCQYPTGSIQWLDLTKKPIRAFEDEVLQEAPARHNHY